MRQRRTKVEEIKQKTNFDSMVKLFQEYDEPPPGATPLRKRLPPNQTPVTPQHRGQPPSSFQTPVPPTLRAQLTRVYNSHPVMDRISLVTFSCTESFSDGTPSKAVVRQDRGCSSGR
jgi:hypothetical protein